jgi:hypothetical protein
MPRSEVSSEELQRMAAHLSSVFYETHLLLKTYENELEKLLGGATLSDLTEGNSGSGRSIVH